MQNQSQVAGILTIVSGFWGIIGAVYTLFLASVLVDLMFGQGLYPSAPVFDVFNAIMKGIYSAMGIFALICGVLGIAGGIFALKKRRWGLALAGAIAGILTFFPCGIVAVIFLIQAKAGFKSGDASYAAA